MKIVFLEKETLGEDIDFTPFNQLGEVELYSRGATVKENADHIADADVLVVNKIPINEELLCKADNLKLIAASATGTNNIDFEYTSFILQIRLFSIPLPYSSIFMKSFLYMTDL